MSRLAGYGGPGSKGLCLRAVGGSRGSVQTRAAGTCVLQPGSGPVRGSMTCEPIARELRLPVARSLRVAGVLGPVMNHRYEEQSSCLLAVLALHLMRENHGQLLRTTPVDTRGLGVRALAGRRGPGPGGDT